MSERITYREIAERAGVSRATVSLALRDHPSITETKRKHVQSVARELGYRPNPLISALMSSISDGRKKKITTSLAILSVKSASTRARVHPGAKEELALAAEHAASLGYALEPIAIEPLETKHKNLQDILRARGITGLILQDSSDIEPHLHGMDLSQFSVVRTGTRLMNLPFHTVVADHYQIVDGIIDVLMARNYRRIGLVLPGMSRITSNGLFEAAFRYRQTRHQGDRLIDVHAPDELQPGDFTHWVHRHRLDAIITTDHKPYIWLRPPHTAALPLVAIAHTDAVDHWWPIAGMDQRRDLQTRAAIDLLAAECSHNRRGLPETPLSVLVPARWREGETVSLKPLP